MDQLETTATGKNLMIEVTGTLAGNSSYYYAQQVDCNRVFFS